MSGKPQFDEANVLAGAVRAFWQHGYAAASLTHLTEATGLSRSSLYQRFKDKDGLFQEALEFYTARVLRRMESAAGATNRARLEKMLTSFLPNRAEADRPAGCLIARSCTESLDLPVIAQAAAVAAAARQKDVIRALLRDAVIAGELPMGTDVDAMAWHFLGVLQAVLNFPHAGADRAVLKRLIAIAIGVWPVSSPLPTTG